MSTDAPPVMITIRKDLLKSIVAALESAAESHRELLSNHIRSLGETTHKNKAIGDWYRNQIFECEWIGVDLKKQIGG